MTHKIGLYGGTFDPIHIGHLIMAENFIDELQLDVLFLIPNKISPFKTNSTLLFNDQERIEFIKESIEGNPKILVDDYEIKKEQISYTIDTVKYFSKKYPQSELYLMIGTDQAANFHLWKDFKNILSFCKLVICRRSFENEKYEFMNYVDQSLLIFLHNPIIEISSTHIRERILEKKSIRYLVADKVWKMIVEKYY